MSGRRVPSASFDAPNTRDPLRTYLHGAPGVLGGVIQHADAAALGAKQPSQRPLTRRRAWPLSDTPGNRIRQAAVAARIDEGSRRDGPATSFPRSPTASPTVRVTVTNAITPKSALDQR
jgi:hypothetical protein